MYALYAITRFAFRVGRLAFDSPARGPVLKGHLSEARDAKRRTRNDERETTNAKRQTQNDERETENDERETENDERETTRIGFAGIEPPHDRLRFLLEAAVAAVNGELTITLAF